MSRFDLNGKVAIVTGGGSGIGKAISLAYANAGADVVVAARGAERLEAAADEIRGLGRRALAVSTDVTEPDQVDALIEQTTREMGKVDIMVANSGGGSSPKLEDITLEDWENQMRLNLSSAFLCDVSAGKAMIAQGTGGRIINISSTAGINLNPGLPAYAAAKAGMISCTKSLALSWAGEGINVNCVAPGFTATEGIRKAGYVPSDTRRDGTKVPPLLMPNEPEHVANVAVFLAAPASSHVTGEVMVVRTMFHMERSDDVLRDRAVLTQ
ncbi:MAG: SDR family NAD(P)-dependent oxidoreductase [Pseudomonadota bacterium]|nr:SDR family NAD(P)-dependent oxidoreductase [Pseudomonadota bacterium]